MTALGGVANALRSYFVKDEEEDDSDDEEDEDSDDEEIEAEAGKEATAGSKTSKVDEGTNKRADTASDMSEGERRSVC